MLSILPLPVVASDLDGDGVADAVEIADGTSPSDGADWKPFSKGLLLCYRFEGDASDISGNGGNGTLYNGPAFVPGVRGQAVSFDGVNDYFARTPVPSNSLPFTWSLWVKAPTSAYGTSIPTMELGQGGKKSPSIEYNPIDATHCKVGLYLWRNGYGGGSSAVLTCADTTAWHHLVLTNDAAGMRRLYLDGGEVAAMSEPSYGEVNNTLYLGGDVGLGYRKQYQADEVRVYNRALSSGEVAAMYANQAPVPSDNANLGNLQLSVGTLSPEFSASTTAYDAEVPFATASLTVTPSVEDAKAVARVRINGGGFVQVASGSACAPLPINPGDNVIEIQVTAENGSVKLYQVSVQRRFPQMVVRENGVELADGSPVPLDFGRATREKPSAKTFTIINSGSDDLLVGAITVEGAHASAFSAGSLSATTLAPGGEAGFLISFRPFSAGVSGATIRIASNAPAGSNSFDVSCSGSGVSYTADSDDDGMNDAAEFNLAAFGFDWNSSQPAMVAELDAGANSAGLYKASQLQALHLGVPMIARDPVSGDFMLKIRIDKSADLIHFTALPVAPPQISINSDGELEFRFNPSDDSAFFRIGAE